MLRRHLVCTPRGAEVAALLVGATRPPKPPRDPQNPTRLDGELRSLAGSSGPGRLSGGSGGAFAVA